MTSQTSQQRLARARDRYQQQTSALALLDRAETGLRAAEKKRTDALTKLDAGVHAAAARRAAALAHLADVLRSETEAAELAGVDLAAVRAAKKELTPEQAGAHLENLTPRRRPAAAAPAAAGTDQPARNEP